MADVIQKSFNSGKKDIKYLNRDFASLKNSIIEFSKTYFPNTYKDFSDASPGMMFIEQAAYIGDVLSYYGDYQFKESLINYASERKNIVALSNFLGYKIKPSKAALSTLDIFQLIPAIKDATSGEYIPDNTYALHIRENMVVANTANKKYITLESVDFATDSKFSPRETTVYSRDDYGIPQFFLLKKNVNVMAGDIKKIDVNIDEAVPYLSIPLPETNVLDILSVVDSDNNNWYKFDYLAQDSIFIEENNVTSLDGNLAIYNQEVPKILKLLKTSKKYIVGVNSKNITYLQFGPGTDSMSDEILYPTAELIGVGLSNLSSLNISYDNSKLLNTYSLGQAPANTILTIEYIIGGGLESNCPADDIKQIVSVQYSNDESGLTPSQLNLLKTIKNSIRITNSTPAVGGADAESVDEIRLNALANFASQNRAVTSTDYVYRLYGMPSRFGTVSKVYVTNNSNLSVKINNNISGVVTGENQTILNNTSIYNNYRKVNYDITNPFSINIYVLSYDSNKNLIPINDALTHNIKKYLEKYKMLSDGLNIIDGYIINIGVDYTITVYNNFNKRDVLLQTLQKVKDFFAIDKMNFNQSININQLELEIAKVNGVQSISEISIYNLTENDGNYSANEYNIEQATKDKIIYPSLDPSVFEVKYPDKDINGSVR